jgi:hypothetical protein
MDVTDDKDECHHYTYALRTMILGMRLQIRFADKHHMVSMSMWRPIDTTVHRSLGSRVYLGAATSEG